MFDKNVYIVIVIVIVIVISKFLKRYSNCHTSSDPLERDVLYGRPLSQYKIKCNFIFLGVMFRSHSYIQSIKNHCLLCDYITSE